MAVFDNYPYTNNHELNLDWIIKNTEKVLKSADEIAANAEIAQEAAENASQSELNAKASEEASADYYALTSQLVGKPLAANTAAEMTDTTTIYVYTGDEAGYEPGHWYYYEDNAWQDGGLYGGDQGISNNARNILKYILEHVVYTDPNMEVYVEALYQALATGGETPTTFTIINALTHVTNSNPATGCDAGDSYTATLTADTNYSIDSVVVTMGDIDITSTVYNNGVINIVSVTGDIVITASASYNGIIVYLNHQIRGTDGEMYENDGRMCSDFIPVTGGSSFTGSISSNAFGIGFRQYDINKDYINGAIGNMDQQTVTGTILSNGAYVRLVSKKLNETTVTSSDIENVTMTINGVTKPLIEGNI